MVARVLKEGIRGWRRWSTVARHSGTKFAPITVEVELLDDLCRECGLTVEDSWHRHEWRPNRFQVDESLRPWLGIIDSEEVRQELGRELRWPQTRSALEEGPPRFVDWRSYAFVLRAADRLLEFREHCIQPGARELAGLVDHTKAWTPVRQQLVADLVGEPWTDLVASRDRQIEIRGPLLHGQAAIWASQIADMDLQLDSAARGLVLVENAETFRHLLPLAEEGWILLHVPGGPPPAEVDLISRIALLDPALPTYAAFDLDPAGVRIARVVQQRTGLSLNPALMSHELLQECPRTIPISEWDAAVIVSLQTETDGFSPLIDEIGHLNRKLEQEPIQRELRQRLTAAATR